MSEEATVKSAKTIWGKYKIPVLPKQEEKRIFEIILNQKSCTESEIREALSFLLSAGLQQTAEMNKLLNRITSLESQVERLSDESRRAAPYEL